MAFAGNCSGGQRSTRAAVHVGLLAMHIAERTTEGRAFPSADGHSSEAEILSSSQRNDDNWLYTGAPVSQCVQPQTARYEFKDGHVRTWQQLKASSSR